MLIYSFKERSLPAPLIFYRWVQVPLLFEEGGGSTFPPLVKPPLYPTLRLNLYNYMIMICFLIMYLCSPAFQLGSAPPPLLGPNDKSIYKFGLSVCVFVSNKRQNGSTDRAQFLCVTPCDLKEGLWMIEFSKICLQQNSIFENARNFFLIPFFFYNLLEIAQYIYLLHMFIFQFFCTFYIYIMLYIHKLCPRKTNGVDQRRQIDNIYHPGCVT